MRNSILTIVSILLGFQMTSKAQPANAKFYLFNATANYTDASIYIWVGCTEPMPYYGYLSSMSNDTIYIKALYGSGGCFFGGSFNKDTMNNVALPTGTNYVNMSTNYRRFNSLTQTYDTVWNKKDTTFILHPTAIGELYKNAVNLRVYPNPAGHTLYLEKGLEYEAVAVYNCLGRQVAVYPKNRAGSIDVSALAGGMYFIKLTGKKEEVIGRAQFLKVK